MKKLILGAFCIAIVIFALFTIIRYKTRILYRIGILSYPTISVPASGTIPLPTGKACSINNISKNEAFKILSNSKNAIKSEGNSEYIQVSTISEKDLEKIALAFDVIDQNDCGLKIFVVFQKGAYLQLQGENWEKWFWTVNACVNNKRVIIDSITGEQVGAIHTHVICGGTI